MPTPRVHLHLRTRQLDACRTFYAALLGAPDKDSDALVRFQPDGVGITLTLMPGEPRPPHPEEHQGLKWGSVEEARAAWARLESVGLGGDATEEAVNCCGAVQDKRWFVDPDGRPWELYAVLDDAPDGPVIDAPISGCCGTEAAPSEAVAQTSTGCCG